MASLIWELDAHSLLDPQSPWRHPQVEGGLVDADDVVLWPLHECSGDVLGELLLLVLEFHLPCNFGAVYDLWLSVCRTVLQVELSNGPCRELIKLKLISPIRGSLLQ